MAYKFLLLLFIAFHCQFAEEGYSQNSDADLLREQIEQAESDSQKVQLKLQLFDELEKTDNQSAMMLEMRDLLRLSSLSDYQRGYMEGLLKLSSHFLNRAMPDSAIIPVREGLSQAGEAEYRLQFLNQRGLISQLNKNPVESIQYYKQALALAEFHNINHHKPQIFYNLSVSQRILGEYSSAFENLYRSLMQFEQAEDYSLMTQVLNDIGDLYYQLDSPEEGIYYLEESEKISRGLYTENHINALISLGLSHTAIGNYRQAAGYFEEADSLIMDSGDMSKLVKLYHNMGDLNIRQGDSESARRYFMEGLELSRSHGHSEGIYYNSIGIGDFEWERESYENAVLWYQSALEQSRELKNGRLIGQSLEKIYNSHRALGQLDHALETLESLKALSDSVKNNEMELSRSELESQLESSRQEQQNRLLLVRQAEQEERILLQRRLGIGILILLIIVLGATITLYRNGRLRKSLNVELESKNKELDQLNHVKNKMFAVVAHDLRGPLSSFQGLLYLLRENSVSGAELDEITENLEKTVYDNSATVENLLVWARSQMSGINLNYRHFKLLPALEAVTSQIQFQAKQKELELVFEVDPELEVHADYDTIKLVLRNLLSNAIKFSHKGGHVHVHADPGEGLTHIRITDTGVGIKEEDQYKIFSGEHYTVKGTNSEKGSGLGLTICKEFVEKHGGGISFESRFGFGTTFHFTLPDPVIMNEDKELKKESADTYQP